MAHRMAGPYNKMKIAEKILGWTIAAGVLLSLGCASSHTGTESAVAVRSEDATTAEIIQAAHNVLRDMHFEIEKLDAEQGVVKTRPLRAAQFFEFWRSDNIGGYNTAEANLQSLRKTVELRVRAEAGDRRPEAEGAYNLQPTASGLHVECDVHVQRLALPPNEIAGVSQAYRIHTQSDRTVQALNVTPEQRAEMAWIDLGEDSDLAAEILRRVEQKLGH